MDPQEMLHLANNANKILLQSQKERYDKQSLERLISILKKKMNTIMIGGISDFEAVFGFIWGAGKEYRELSKEQKEFRVLWDAVRKKLLDKGNDQIRAAEAELCQYSVTWKRYNKVLPVKERKEDGKE